MLVITRKAGEGLVLHAGEIKVTVVSIKGNTVRLGIQAPPGVRVEREEVRGQGQDEPRRRS